MDKEKVIKGMEMCISPGECSPDDCPYYDRPRNESGLCWDRLMTDALSMLKEQEEKTGHWIVLEFCANEGIYCSECHMKIFDRVTKPKDKLSRYCPHCGSKNEQFFRDGEVVFR